MIPDSDSQIRHRVLLVDDSKTFVQLLSAALWTQNSEITACDNAASAREHLADPDAAYDLICSAYYLSDMEGIALCQAVRQMPRYADVPFVLLTSVDDPHALETAMPAGVTEVFHKKSVEQLLNFIRRTPSAHEKIHGKVLYIEDDRSQQAAMQATLEHRGLTVVSYRHAADALLHFMREDFDLVLTDVVLEGQMSGLALANQIRRQPGSRGDVPIIALTGFDDRNRRFNLYNLGVTDYVIKPVIECELFARIKSHLQHRRLHLAAERQREQQFAQTLQDTEARFQSLFLNTTEGVALHDPVFNAEGLLIDYRVISVNPAWTLHTGQDAKSLTGRTASAAFHLTPPPFLAEIDGALRNQQSREFEMWLDPLQRHLRARIVPLGEGQTGGFATIIEDITGRKTTESLVLQHRDQLERQVQQRTQELHEKFQQLQQAQDELIQSSRLSSLGKLVAGVAHELNTPIGNARTVATTLHTLAETFTDSFQANNGLRRSDLSEFLNQTGEGARLLDTNLERAAELIQSFKQVAVDRTSSQRRQFQLDLVTKEVLQTLRPTLKKHPVTVKTDIAPDITIDGYPGPFGQIVVNLVENALIHGLQDRAEGCIVIAGRREGDVVHLTVEDNGKGIAAEHLPRIFDPFFTTRLGLGGSGLGLNIVFNIVTGLLGGKIEAISQPEAGSRFHCTLPLIAPQDNSTPATVH